MQTLTAEQRAKRVAICQDVLLQMAAGRYRVKHGTYLETTRGSEITTPKQLAAVARCEVCAMGAVFASKVACFNAPPEIFDFQSLDEWDNSGGQIDDNLIDIFPDIRIIESIFEHVDGRDVLLGVRGADRLAGIMLEIIASDGELVS